MAELVSESQFIRRGVIYPRPAYSRITTLELNVPGGGEDYQVSDSIATNTYLLSVQIYATLAEVSGLFGCFFYLCAGTGTRKDTTATDIVYNWKPVIGNPAGSKPGLRLYGDKLYLKWEFVRRFSGEGLRFGSVIENWVPDKMLYASIFLQIAEG